MNEQTKVVAKRKLAAWMENTDGCRVSFKTFNDFWFHDVTPVSGGAFTAYGTNSKPKQPTRTGSIEDRIVGEWDNDPAVRAEFFENFAAYRAFRMAEERGLVRMADKGVRQ